MSDFSFNHQIPVHTYVIDSREKKNQIGNIDADSDFQQGISEKIFSNRPEIPEYQELTST